MEKVRNEHSLNLCSATNDKIITLGLSELYVKPSDIRAKIESIVIKGFPVNILIRTDCMGEYVTGGYPTKRQLKALRSKPSAILSTGVSDRRTIATASALYEEESHDTNCTGEGETKKTFRLRVTKQPSDKLNSPYRVIRVSKRQVIMYFEHDEDLGQLEQLTFGRGTMEVHYIRLLSTSIVKLTNSEIHISRNIAIGQSNNTLSIIVDPEFTWQQLLVDNHQTIASLISSPSTRVNKYLKGGSRMKQSIVTGRTISRS